MKYYDTLLCGATFFAAQAAARLCRCGKPALIVERGILPAGDFALPLLPCGGEALSQTDPFGISVAEEALRRHMLSSPLALPYLLASELQKAKVPVLFGAQVLDWRRTPSGIDVRLFCESGEETVRVGRILDTTAIGVFSDNPAGATASLGAIVSGEPVSALPLTPLTGSLSVLRLPCASLPDGRQALVEAVRGTGLSIVSFAKALGWHYPAPYESERDGVFFCPSVSYASPWDALRGAAAFCRKEGIL